MVKLMKSFLYIMLLALLSSQVLAANDEALEIAKKIAIGGDVTDFEANAEAMADRLILGNPSLEPHKAYISNGILEILESDDFQTKVASVYVSYFTMEELREFEKLLDNPAMIKWLQVMPEVMPAILDVQRPIIESGLAQLFQNIPEE